MKTQHTSDGQKFLRVVKSAIVERGEARILVMQPATDSFAVNNRMGTPVGPYTLRTLSRIAGWVILQPLSLTGQRA